MNKPPISDSESESSQSSEPKDGSSSDSDGFDDVTGIEVDAARFGRGSARGRDDASTVTTVMTASTEGVPPPEPYWNRIVTIETSDVSEVRQRNMTMIHT